MSEHGDHILIGLTAISISTKGSKTLLYLAVKMVYLVALVENVAHHLRRRSINDSGRNNVGHITMIVIFWYLQLRVGIKLANRSQMHISAAILVSSNRRGFVTECLP